MYLKSLELQGFKSFADRTLIRFDDDITAIVGPNGSGKSNISDAIRWVMGEMRTKELRGAKMEDVIFGGTQSRPALGFAEATLTLDNSDGVFRIEAPEVAITRRYYRSGESEYYINRQSARLRDISELFMDTGLGREGYSNIGQGRIDEIVSLKSTDRREIFEEAAGISKYRHRKEETERRLANTEDNLLRIGDKISELELQVGPLRKQAEQAKKYLHFRDELKGLEVTVWLDTLDKLAKTAKKAEEDYTSAAFVLEQQHDELNRLYAAAEQSLLQLNQMTLQADEKRDRISEQESALQQTETKLSVDRTNLQNSKENLERLRDEIADQKKQTSGVQEKIETHKTRIEEIRAEVEALQEQLLRATSEFETAVGAEDERRKMSARDSAQAALLLTQISAKKAELASVSASMSEVVARKNSLAAESEELSARLSAAEEQAAQTAAQLKKAREDAASEENTIRGYALRENARKEKRERLQTATDELEIEEKTVRSRITMLQEMRRDYEGFSKAVKIVMNSASNGQLSGVCGPVSDLIRTKNEHSLAIESALGGAMQDVVVESRSAAKACIRFLSRCNGGRATFAPIEAMIPRSIREKGLESEPGFVGIAADLVMYDKKYENVIRNLLGAVAVAEDLDAASEISKHYSSRFRIVTLDGQIVNSGGSMTGGSASKNAGMLSRANELTALEEKQKTLAEHLAASREELAEAIRVCEEAAYQTAEAQTQLRKAEDDVLRLEGEKRQYEILLESLREALSARQREIAEIDSRNAGDEARLNALNREIAALSDDHALLERKVSEYEAQSGATDGARKELTEKITALKMEIAAKDAEQEAALNGIEQLLAITEQLRGDQAQKDARIAEFEAECDRLTALIAEDEALRDEQQKRIEEKKQELQQFLAERNAVEQTRTKADRDAQEKNKEIVLMERETARLEQKKATSAMEEKQILDKLWDSYELTRTTAQDVAVEVESIAAANRRIAELRKGISSLGTPNLGAIEEFERVNERYTYLTGQRDDVQHAKRELEQIVSSITQQMEELFLAEFGKISACFTATFTEMFGGGKASLELEDPNDPLSCGIEIRVQPPGKQLKTITLLSGGEKAFVAIALYFAILQVRPASFCLLDEIDAALDDNNVARFNKKLRAFSDKTQFIVITHRRGTMEAADALYGVTMQEKGVSRILHVDLRQIEQQMHIES